MNAFSKKYIWDYSYLFIATSGVAQGSHLSSISFFLFSNEVVPVFRVSRYKYFDFSDDIENDQFLKKVLIIAYI